MKTSRSEAALLVAVFFDLLGFGMVIPDIQLRAEHLVPPGWPKGLLIGAALASTFVIQMLVSPMWGKRSDQTGRKGVLMICQALSAAAMLVYGLAGSFAWIVVSRCLAGLGAANVAVAQAVVADAHSEQTRTAAMGRMGAAISLGLIAGPVLTGVLAQFEVLPWLGYLAAGFSTIGLVCIALFVPNQPPVVKPDATDEPKPKRSFFNFGLLRDLPELRPLVLIAIIAWFSLATLEGTFGRLLADTLGYGQREFGMLFAWESFLGVAIQGFALVWIAKRIQDTPLLRFSYICQGVGLALTPAAASLIGVLHPLGSLFIASTLYALGSSIANPTVNSLCSKLAPKERQGELFGMLQSTRSIGFAIGPLIGGVLYDWRVASPYWMAGAVCCLAAFLVPRLAAHGD